VKASFSGNKPGADDDGSGSVTVMETANTILASDLTFKKPLYFMWYAAEEEGLVGSGYVVSEFKKKHIPVDAVLHFDLTGYAYQNESTMWLIDDYVNKNLVNFLDKLITTYVKQPVKHTQCGYACSDHATWTKNGYAAAIPAEAAYENTNPSIHSTNDSMDKLSLSHMSDYLKLATAFAVELAEPTRR
jgi:leucyl aminopeptidase